MLTDLTAYIDGTTVRTTAVTTTVVGQVLYAAEDGLRPATSMFPSYAARVAGLAENSATTGDELRVVTNGLWRGTTPWPAGTPLFLGLDSHPTPDPDTGLVCLPLGHVHAPGVIHVQLGRPIVTGA